MEVMWCTEGRMGCTKGRIRGNGDKSIVDYECMNQVEFKWGYYKGKESDKR